MQLPLFPLHTVLFPHLPLPLHIFEERYRAMATDLLAERSPFAGRFVEEKYEGKVRLSYRDFPLRQIHPQAQKAA